MRALPYQLVWRTVVLFHCVLLGVALAAFPADAVVRTVCKTGGCQHFTIKAAIDTGFTAGDTIKVYAGTYREQVNIDTKTGSSGNPAVLMAATTPVIIDGTDAYDTTGQWQQHTGNVWKATNTAIFRESQVFVGDVRYTWLDDTTYTTLPYKQWESYRPVGLLVKVVRSRWTTRST